VPISSYPELWEGLLQRYSCPMCRSSAYESGEGSMKWTKEVPTKNGWYWCQSLNDKDEPDMRPHVMYYDHSKEWAKWMHNKGYNERFSGPIPLPKEEK
jgi:hypothetical protein